MASSGLYRFATLAEFFTGIAGAHSSWRVNRPEIPTEKGATQACESATAAKPKETSAQ